MIHNRKHAGWATAARRRGEQYVACATCGQPAHRATEPHRPRRRHLTIALLALYVALGVVWWIVFAAFLAAR